MTKLFNPATGEPASPTPKSVYPPRIWKVEFLATTKRRQGQKIIRYIKVPYGDLFRITDALDRAALTWQIGWFKLEPATAITSEVRGAARRWGDLEPELEASYGLSFAA